MVLSCNDCGRPSSERQKASGACKMYTKMLGTGSALPRQRISNNDLAMLVDTSDEWITSRTGISERGISAGDSTSGLAAEAAAHTLADASVEPSNIDLVISAGSVKKCV